MTTPRPFLRWVGGKTQLLPELLKRTPLHGVYHEPFLGGGAFFFALQPKQACLSDSNDWLVRTYLGVRDDVERVIAGLHETEKWYQSHGNGYYLTMRDANPHAWPNADLASWFIFLNKTNYNGLFRVNQSGKFNVPPGKFKNPPRICDEENLRACAAALQKTYITRQDFRMVERQAAPCDFVYMDPPYIPLSTTSDFTGYTATGFKAADQIALRDVATRLKARGVNVLLSNSSASVIDQLYAGFTIEKVAARRSVNSKAEGRGAVMESLIS